MKGRRSLAVQAGRLIQRVPLSWGRALESPLVRLGSRRGSEPCLIVLLALPRSGSTLTYQCLIHALQPLYLSNLWNMLYALPWSGGSVSAKRCAGHHSDFRSTQGFVGGLCGPAEGMRFWSYWCGCGLDESSGRSLPEARLQRRLAYLRQTLSVLTSPEKPMVTGYLGHVLAFDRLREWFPEAVFVRLHRDPLSNAVSILRSRQHDPDTWFSVFPRECDGALSGGLFAQIASQVYWLNRRLEAVQNDPRAVHVTYEDLCGDPNAELRRIASFCNDQGSRLEVRESLPGTFPYRSAVKSESEDIAALARELENLEARYGSLAGTPSGNEVGGCSRC